jgi:hypothetical protein
MPTQRRACSPPTASGAIWWRSPGTSTLLTTLTELNGYEEPRGRARPMGAEHGVNPDRETWLERRRRESDELGHTVEPCVAPPCRGRRGFAVGCDSRPPERMRDTDGMEHQTFSEDKARAIGEAIGIDWATSPFDVAQFRMGLDVELEHGRRDPATNVSDDDELTTGKIARAHLNEFPDYYTRLERMEAEAEAYWSERRRRPAV